MTGPGIPRCQLCGGPGYKAAFAKSGDPIWLCRLHRKLATIVENMVITCGVIVDNAVEGGHLPELAETFAQEIGESTGSPHGLSTREVTALQALGIEMWKSCLTLLRLIFKSKELLVAGYQHSAEEPWQKTTATL